MRVYYIMYEGNKRKCIFYIMTEPSLICFT